MNLRPRHREDPEINLISLIDVLLVLLIFFMVSTTFNQEGRVKVQLPQASDTPVPRGLREPVVITVTADGNYRVNERTLINSSPVAQGGRDRAGSDHHTCRCPHHAPSRGDRNGRRRQTRVRAAQYRDRA